MRVKLFLRSAFRLRYTGSGANQGALPMSWETTKQGRRVYYRAKRVNGRVVKSYIGRGSEAEQAALEDANRRQERDARRQVVRAARQEWQDVDRAARTATYRINLLFQAALVAAGYYQHARGEWRRRGGGSYNRI